MATKGNITQLLKIAARRSQEALNVKLEALKRQHGISREANEKTRREAVGRVVEALQKDLAKVNEKFNTLVEKEITAHPVLHAYGDRNRFSVDRNYMFNIDRDVELDQKYQTSHEALLLQYRNAYETLELTLALSESPAALKEEFEKFLKSLA